jgi:hypothetical protein
MSLIRAIGTVLVWVSTVEAVGFVVLYHMVAPWWRTSVGRSVMGLLSVIAVILLLSGIRMALGGDTLVFAWIRLVVFAGLPVVIAQRTLLLIRLQLHTRRAEQEDNEHATPEPR